MEDTNNNNQKPITLDHLAAMVKRGFDDMDKQLNDIKMELASKSTQTHVDSRFDALEKSMNESVVGDSLNRDRKLNEKTNVVAQKLGDKSVFTRNDVRDVERISPVAVSPTI